MLIKKRHIVLIWAISVLAVFGQEDNKDVQTLTSFRVPEFDEQGRMKSQIFGDFAEVLPDGVIKITKLTMEFYTGSNVDMRVTAPRCIYDKERGGAASDSEVKIVRDNMEVTGVGFAWNARREKFQIFKQVRVVLTGVRSHMDSGEKEAK
jgi:lipopolysaccharide export system protein LptC